MASMTCRASSAEFARMTGKTPISLIFRVTLDLFIIDSRRFGFRRKQMNYKQSHRISRSRDSEKTLALLLKLKISETLFRFLALYRQTGRLRSARCFFILRNIGQEITRQRKLLLIWYRHC